MIELTNVTKDYSGTVAVDNLSFEVKEGEFCVLIGPSGCGKSTTLRLINRLIKATMGKITIEGTDIISYRPEELRRHIGYAIQSIGLFPHMTVAQNMAVVPKLLKWEPGKIAKRVDLLFDLFNLDPRVYGRKYPRELSGGESQRVGVARALAADPAILLMDEPFGAIDPLTRETLQTEFARIQRELKKTILFVTHDIDEAIRLASRIVILKEGRMVQHDTPENILTSPANKFVLVFIGTDRALKRLSRLTVREFMSTTLPVRADIPMESASKAVHARQYVWVIDGEGIVLGWLDESAMDRGGTAAETMTKVGWREYALMPDSTLKEAVSRMVQQGIRTAPVVDVRGRLLGEIKFTDILDA